MATGITVEIVGTDSNTQGRSCEEHDVCGSMICEDDVVRFRKVQVVINGMEESGIAAYVVSASMIDNVCGGCLHPCRPA
jgi:hypothetical protein